ncbi:hypothetical protein G6W41_03640 [Campylobacter concisus]|nr:hypothetical protein [Campylobacter concisus]MBE9863216.1 hypothetical protein [Campylobacter concisus]
MVAFELFEAKSENIFEFKVALAYKFSSLNLEKHKFKGEIACADLELH